MVPTACTVLGDALGFTEGPTVMPDGSVICVSIDQGRVYKIDSAGVSVLALLGGGPNGATADEQGRVYVAQTGGYWGRAAYPDRRDPGVTGGIQVIEPDGSVRYLTREPRAPNDLCIGPDGMLYVTDPTRRTKGQGDGILWRCDPETGAAEKLAVVDYFCNGIGFGKDERLYVVSSRASQILRYDLSPKLSDPTVVCDLGGRVPDGFAFDTEGNLIIGALGRNGLPGRVEVYSPDGKLQDVVELDGKLHPTNVALSGDNRLIISDSLAGRLLCIDDWPTAGLALHSLRANADLAPALTCQPDG